MHAQMNAQTPLARILSTEVAHMLCIPHIFFSFLGGTCWKSALQKGKACTQNAET